ncbi:hypothetical protein EMPG_13756 [Blastomyces silverae]|uniref:Uncharacterized protein n=1 Tax=Blastomyces silverae TaxID=2060906 RepID=A0A0H1BHF1_9EURO|nr:hypothetical protein EMPG_13756 [Blastomyces silverae]
MVVVVGILLLLIRIIVNPLPWHSPLRPAPPHRPYLGQRANLRIVIINNIIRPWR